MARDRTQLLPEDVLLNCFPAELARVSNSLRLVCKRWRRVFDTSPRLTEFKFLYKLYEDHCLVPAEQQCASADGGPRRLPSLTGAEFDGSGLLRMARSRAGVTRSALLDAAHLSGVLQAARLLTGLTHLRLSASHNFGFPQRKASGDHPSYGEALAQHPLQLGGLTRLQSLQLDVDDVQAATCRQLSELTTLTSLKLQTFADRVPAELWQACAALPRLAALSLAVQPRDDGACMVGEDGGWAQLAGCTQLTGLTVKSGMLDEFGDNGAFKLSPGVTALTSLRHLRCEGQLAGLGDIWQHTGLTSLHLHLHCPAGGIHLQPSAVNMPALRRLQLGGWLDPELVPPQLAGLTGITSLSISSENTDVVLEELPLMHELRRMPLLSSLTLYSEMHDIPESVTNLTTLRHLDVSASSIMRLSPGPYLRNLRALVLAGTELTSLPPELSECRQLEVLDISCSLFHGQSSNITQMVLRTEDLLLLGKMRTLRLLCVPGSATGVGFADDVVARANLMVAVLIGALLPALAIVTEGVHDQALLLPDGGVDMAVVHAMLGRQQPLLEPFIQAVGTDLGWLRAAVNDPTHAGA